MQRQKHLEAMLTLLRSAFQGLWVTVTRDSLGMGAFFLSFEKAQRALTRHRYGRILEGRPPDADILLASGSTAGVSYWIGTITIPFLDVPTSFATQRTQTKANTLRASEQEETDRHREYDPSCTTQVISPSVRAN